MFWAIVALAIVMIVGMYYSFGALSENVSGDFGKVVERKTIEYETYVEENIACGQVALDSPSGFMGASPSIPIRVKNKIETVSKSSIDNGLTEITLKGKFNGQFTTFWIRERPQDVADPTSTNIFILYLRDSGPYQDFTKKESLLAGPEFGLIIPYIPSDAESIISSGINYANSPITFQAYILNEITSVLDYVTVSYNSPQIVAYGEGWGSVLARELAIIDSRIDLVITNKFPGDPYETISANGYYSFTGLENRLYVMDTGGCLPSAIGSFGRLMPISHIYVGPSSYNSFYSLGTKKLSELIERRYLDSGIPERFTYIELEDLNATYNTEILKAIQSVLISTD